MLDLGCGAGQLAFHLAKAGAEEVVAIDASERMLEVARSRRAHPRVAYRLMTMEEGNFDAGSFDAVVSSLSLHYVRDYAGLVRRIARWLRPEGLLVLSTEHPIFTARATAEGWIVDSEGHAQPGQSTTMPMRASRARVVRLRRAALPPAAVSVPQGADRRRIQGRPAGGADA